MKINLIVALFAVMALAAGVFLQQSHHDNVATEHVRLQLDFSFPDSNGQLQSVSQWQGRILVINFWGTWCPPCLKEMPEFIQWQQAYQADNVQFVGIAIDDQQSVTNYLKTLPINYPILIAGDEGSRLSQQLGNIINAVPFTVIVNQAGQIVHRQPGELSRQQFLDVLQPLLGKNQ
jgi:thiol-disulfide isomerase/thioredoxin